MDFNEIRIGNYVRSHADQNDYQIIDMCRLRDDALPLKSECVNLKSMEDNTSGYDVIEDLEPIEINEDFLKVNGFSQMGDSIEYRMEGVGNPVITCFPNTVTSIIKNTYSFTIIGRDREGLFREFRGDIHYIHNLQNIVNDIANVDFKLK